jgi:hypothetical protein
LAYERQDRIIYNVVSQEVTTFSETVKEVGYIDKTMLNGFYAKIHGTGLDYDIHLEHLEKVFTEDGGEIKAHYDGHYTEDIIEFIESHGPYKFRVGDFFFLRVSNNGLTKSQSLRLLLGLKGKGPGIYYTGGGVIRYGDD